MPGQKDYSVDFCFLRKNVFPHFVRKNNFLPLETKISLLVILHLAYSFQTHRTYIPYQYFIFMYLSWVSSLLESLTTLPTLPFNISYMKVKGIFSKNLSKYFQQLKETLNRSVAKAFIFSHTVWMQDTVWKI